MLNKLKAYILLIRPLNVIISVLSVWTAVYISKQEITIEILFLTGITAAFLIAAANSINDVFDIETDKINKPNRPIAAGLISITAGKIFSGILLVIALIPNFFLPISAFIIILFAVLFVVIYTPFLKAKPFWGNFIVSLVTACGFLYGAAAVSKLSSGFFPFIIAFSIHFLREIIKDMEDLTGDKLHGARTLAAIISVKTIHALISTLIVFLMVLIITPYFLNVFGIYYLLIVLCLEPVYLYLLYQFLKQKTYDKETYKKGSAVLKASMLIGLIAFLAG